MITLQSIMKARADWELKYRPLFDPKGASILAEEYFKATYKEIYKEEPEDAPRFSDIDNIKRYLNADLTISVISTLSTAEASDPHFAKGADLDLKLKLLVDRRVNIKAKCLLEVQSSSAAYPYIISAGAQIKNSENEILFETLQDTTITGDRASFYFTAINAGAALNGLNSATGLVLLPRAGTTDLNILTYQIYPSAGGVDYESDEELLLRYYSELANLSASSKMKYKYSIKYTFPEVTDVYVKDVDILTKGTVNIFLSLVGGQIYSTNFLDLVKRTIYARSQVTDSIVMNYATPVTLDLSTTVITSTSILSQSEKQNIISKINLYFSENTIGATVYKSRLISIILAANTKIVNVTMGLPDEVIVGETSFASPDYGAGITFNTL